MSLRPFYLTDVTDYITIKNLEYALIKKENLKSVGSHRHSFLEISFVISGLGSETINGSTHPMKSGTLSLLLPYHIHELYSDPESPLCLFNLAICFDSILGTEHDFGLRDLLFFTEDNLSPFLQLEGENFEKVLSLFNEMYEESKSKLRWSDLIVKSKLVEVLVLFNRLRQSTSLVVPIINDCSSDIFWNIVQYVHTNYYENITLDSLEEHFHVHTYKISKLFKDKIGENFHHFLNHIRIQHACSLLISSDMTVTDIALETGYESYVTFSKTFRKYTGISAIKYRKAKGDI